MSQQETGQNNGLSGFAGMVVLIAFLAIFFILMSPDRGASTAAPQPEAEVAQVEPSATPVPTNTPEPTDVPTEVPTEAPTDVPTEAAATESTGSETTAVSFDPELAAQGEPLFVLCSACHGADGRGVTGIGKDLVESEFVSSLTDEELVQFIIVGRPIWDPLNTTGLDMPGKGGNPALSTEEIGAIVAYIRSLQSAHSGAATDGAEEAPADDTTTEAAAETSAVSFDPELAAQGEPLFVLCAACHGADARGVTGIGKDLVDSEFVSSLTDEELVQFIVVGRPIWDPLNTTGLDMPGKGGNPALSTEDIGAIVAYIRSLQSTLSGE